MEKLGFKKTKNQENITTSEKMLNLVSEILKEAELIEIKKEDRNKEGELLVSINGVVSKLGKESELWWKMVRTKKFKDFFGDWQDPKKPSSKIVDKNGEPLVLFRTTEEAISAEDFYNQRYYEQRTYSHGDGVYFSPDESQAETFRHENGVKFSALINIRNPKYTENFLGTILEDMRKLRKTILLKLPKNIIDKIPKIPIHIGYDCVLGGSKKSEKPKDRMLLSEHKDIEDVYEAVIRKVDQVLIIPNRIN